MKIEQVSANSLLVTFGEIISKKISLKVQNAFENINNINDKAIIEIIPSYTSIFISFDILIYDYQRLQQILKNTLSKVSLDIPLKNKEIINIDVYYGLEVGLDLNKISKENDIPIEEIIKLHSSKIYDVYAIGFLAGFAFLGKVDKNIRSPRLDSPRAKVLKGSVAIANSQTAVYPSDSAGGWNIIGKTTKELFDTNLKNLSELSIGKQVKFNPITKQEFINQGGEL